MGSSRSLDWVADELMRFHAAGVARGRGWSLAQVTEHLALAVEGTVHTPSSDAPPAAWRKLSPWTRAQRTVMKHLLLATGRFPAGVNAPSVVVPSDAPRFEPALARLGAASAALEAKLGQRDARWVFHPLLGKMSGRQWLRFHQIHSRYHLDVLRRANAGQTAAD